jgi:hypothetical protein
VSTAERYLEVLYHKVKTIPIKLLDTFYIWRLSPNSSKSSRIISAMLNYGIIEDDGSSTDKKIRITSLGENILQIKEPVIMQISYRREAVLNDDIMLGIFLEFDKLPNDSEIEMFLSNNWDFTNSAIEQFIPIIRENYEYARLEFDTIIRDTLIKKENLRLVDSLQEETSTKYSRIKSRVNMSQLIPVKSINYRIPLDDGNRFAYLVIPDNIEEENINLLEEFLLFIVNRLKLGGR